MKCPPILDQIIFADDAKLAAQLCCALSRPRFYLPVCDGPRIQRPDRELEVLRRHNVAARARARTAYMAGLSDDAFASLSLSLQSNKNLSCLRISSSRDIARLAAAGGERKTLMWGRDRIGAGLLKALRAQLHIQCEDRPSPYEWVPSKGGHIVVCEEGEELSQVIAANYAFALDAGLFLIPEVDRDHEEALLEQFYALQNQGALSPAEVQARLRQELLNLCGSIPVPDGGSITFIGKLPFGLS